MNSQGCEMAGMMRDVDTVPIAISFFRIGLHTTSRLLEGDAQSQDVKRLFRSGTNFKK